MSDLRHLLITWNNTFPFDRLWREKYNVPFGSKKHKSMCQIDIYLDILEDRLFHEYREEQRELKEMEGRYKSEGFINKNYQEKDISDERFNDIFNNIDVTEFNKSSDQ